MIERVFALMILGWALPFFSASARVIDMTRACFPGFCVESRQVFTTSVRNVSAGKYRLLLSREQATLYLEAGPKPAFPKCGACDIEERPGERIARRKHTHQIMGRLVGPFEGCKGAEPFYVHIHVYLPDADPGVVSVARQC